MVSMHVLGHGIDLVQTRRIARLLQEHGDRFRNRCFTPAEQVYAEAARRRRAERYAARFACKEAVLKALGTGWRNGIAWTDIEVLREPSGRPGLRLAGECARHAAGLGIARWLVSLSHAEGDAGYAVASVIACGTATADG